MGDPRNEIPGWEGSTGPGPGQYDLPHVYARDTRSGAGNCVCSRDLGHELHVQAAPGVDVPECLRRASRRRQARADGLAAVQEAARTVLE